MNEYSQKIMAQLAREVGEAAQEHPDKKPLEAWAQKVSERHCYGLGAEPCTLSSQQGWNLMELAMKIAAQHGYDNGGTGGIGYHPTQEIPLLHYEMWMNRGYYRTWYTIILEVNWEKSTARFYSEHTGCDTYKSGCKKCSELRELYAQSHKKQ